eukprot:GHVP01065170.1.p1 GENE.GHVP01065170.1~~GHVP01065170.1.p1  ORF type:complete len:146 (+),score=14.38 GHVP01065170.1:443-880(+)
MLLHALFFLLKTPQYLWIKNDFTVFVTPKFIDRLGPLTKGPFGANITLVQGGPGIEKTTEIVRGAIKGDLLLPATGANKEQILAKINAENGPAVKTMDSYLFKMMLDEALMQHEAVNRINSASSLECLNDVWAILDGYYSASLED